MTYPTRAEVEAAIDELQQTCYRLARNEGESPCSDVLASTAALLALYDRTTDAPTVTSPNRDAIDTAIEELEEQAYLRYIEYCNQYNPKAHQEARNALLNLIFPNP
jgi:hypothetical protein